MVQDENISIMQSGYKEKLLCRILDFTLWFKNTVQWSNSQKANFIGFKKGQF